MDIIERVNVLCEKKLDSLAEQIKNEMVAVCLEHKKTGDAAESVFIEKTSEKTRFIGSENKHFYWLDQGNGGKGTIITPNGNRPMRFKGYKAPYTGKWYSKWYVHGYDGIHFVRKIAQRHGGD